MTGRPGARITAAWFDEVQLLAPPSYLAATERVAEAARVGMGSFSVDLSRVGGAAAPSGAEVMANIKAAYQRLGLWQLGLSMRRDLLVREVATRYGVTLHRHPRRTDVVVVSASDDAWLRDAVEHDSRLDAVGRGYFLGLGGELRVWVAPDWTCDPLTVSLLRLYVVTLYRPLSRLARALTCLLSLHMPGSCR